MEREEPEDDQAAVEAEEKNGIGEQQKQLDEELRQQEMQEREDKHTGAMYDFAQAGNTVQNRGKRKVTRTFINDEGEEVTRAYYRSRSLLSRLLSILCVALRRILNWKPLLYLNCCRHCMGRRC